MPHAFITATGTDVGKTFVTAGLIRHYRRAGRTVDALKPVISGFDPAAAMGSDTIALLSALEQPISDEAIARISPWRFLAPLSPDMAARREGRSLDYDGLLAFSRHAIDGNKDTLLIEGVGGIMVPLDDRHTVFDWMQELRLPILLVAGGYLGTISHTLTALQVLAQRSLPVAGVVVSESEHNPVPLEDTVETLSHFSNAVDIVMLPRLADEKAGGAAFARIAGLIDKAH